MRQVLVVAAVSLCALLPIDAVSAAQAHEDRPVAAFTAVKLVGAIDLVVTQAANDSLSIEGEAADLKDVMTEVKEGVLVISHNTGWSLLSWFRVPSAAPRAVLNAKDLRRIVVEGSGAARAQSLIVSDKFEIQVTGSGDVQVGTLAAKSVDVRIAGSGDVRLAGAVLDEAVRIAGSGDYFGGDLKSATSKVSIAGSGDAVVWVRDKLEVSISGSGDLQYYGTPAVNQSSAGSGRVKGLGAKS
jgi:hypothetical protein